MLERERERPVVEQRSGEVLASVLFSFGVKDFRILSKALKAKSPSLDFLD